MKQTPTTQWLFTKWRWYDDLEGRRTTQKEFADFLTFDKNFLSLVLAGKRNLGLESTFQVYKATGDPTIFDVTPFADRKPKVMSSADWIASRSTEDLIAISKLIESWKREIEARGIDVASPESEEILKEMAAKSKL